MRSRARATLVGLVVLAVALSLGGYGYETTTQPVMTSITTSEVASLIQSMSGDGVTSLAQATSDPGSASLEIRFSSGRHAWIQFYNKHRVVTCSSAGAMTGDGSSYSCLLLQTGFAVSGQADHCCDQRREPDQDARPCLS